MSVFFFELWLNPSKAILQNLSSLFGYISGHYSTARYDCLAIPLNTVFFMEISHEAIFKENIANERAELHVIEFMKQEHHQNFWEFLFSQYFSVF